MDPFQLKDQSTLILKDWMIQSSYLTAGITTRAGGVSSAPFHSLNLGFHVPDRTENVVQNRQMVADLLDLPLETWVMGQQVHGTNVVTIQKEDQGRGSFSHDDTIQGVDGILTNQEELLCTALFADCVPIFYFDPNTNWIGIAHAGWRGTVNGIAKQMVTQLSKQAVDLNSLRVAIGPCISKTRYEVDDNVINHIPTTFKQHVVTPLQNGHYLLDLRQLNKQILLQSGVQETNISVTNYCTYDNQNLFFSHRRDHGETGRMLGFIGRSKRE